MKLEFDGDSWITHVSYDTETREMVVSIAKSNDSYALQNVTLKEFEAFKASGSRGTHFNNVFKGKGQYKHKWFK